MVNFNPSRLILARRRRMLNKKELADRLRVDLKTIGRWEGGQSDPAPESIDAISSELNFPNQFFFGGNVDEPIGEHTSFRSQTAMSAAERDAALAAGQIGFMISDWVTERFDLPPPKLPDLRMHKPDVAARMLRKEWGLGEQPIPNMIKLLESKGVKVFSLAENTVHVNAYSLWRKNVPFVFLNNFKSAECSRFDAAHELAHLVLHQDGGVTGRPAEEQANQFASAFLMPEADVRGTIPQIHNLKQLIVFKQRWRVSLAALNYRVHKIGLISDWKYRDFCISMNVSGYNTKEPVPIERERSVVWEKVLKALWAENTTHHDIADQMFIPESEVSDLLFGLLGEPTPAIKAESAFSLVRTGT
jgi:Zn-dependent peptidase ImmA (M78 family)